MVNKFEAEQTKDKDPVSMHQKPTCRVEEGPKIRGKDGKMETYHMCKTCCREVHFIGASPVVEEDECGALMF